MFPLNRSVPCKQIAPKFVSFSKKYPSVLFWKVDVGICRVSSSYKSYCSSLSHPATFILQSIVMRYEINAMPTFLFFKNREKVHQVLSFCLVFVPKYHCVMILF